MEVRDEVVDRVPVWGAWADSMEGAALAVRADDSWGLSTNEGEERVRKEFAAHGGEGVFHRERVESEVAVRGYRADLNTRNGLMTRVYVGRGKLRPFRLKREPEEKKVTGPGQDHYGQSERPPPIP